MDNLSGEKSMSGLSKSICAHCYKPIYYQTWGTWYHTATAFAGCNWNDRSASAIVMATPIGPEHVFAAIKKQL